MMNTGTLTKRSKTIYVYDLKYNLIDEIIGLSNVSRKYGVRFQNLYKVLNGYKTSLNGYNFSYIKFQDMLDKLSYDFDKFLSEHIDADEDI